MRCGGCWCGGEEAGRLERLRDAVAIGSTEFAQRVRAWGAEAPLDGAAGKRESYRRVPVAEVRRVVEEAKGEPWARFAERYGDWGCALFLWGVRRVRGLTLREAGQTAGGIAAAAVYKAAQRLSAQAARNPTLPEAQQRIPKLSKVQPDPHDPMKRLRADIPSTAEFTPSRMDAGTRE